MFVVQGRLKGSILYLLHMVPAHSYNLIYKSSQIQDILSSSIIKQAVLRPLTLFPHDLTLERCDSGVSGGFMSRPPSIVYDLHLKEALEGLFWSR